ncbi:MAG: nucleotide sugar dehydrogenase [Chitinophagaceae bacterium]
MKRRKISIVGFGKIGQALAAHILQSGIHVHAIDRDLALLQSFSNGSFISSEPGVSEILVPAFGLQILTISTDPLSASESSAIILSIPLSVNARRLPDSSAFVETIISLSANLVQNTMLVIETSVPVGFCRQVIATSLEATGKVHGRDFYLAHSPERIKSGTMLRQLGSVPKIIGGLTKEAGEAAADLYGYFFSQANLALLPSIESAEMVKMAGMMYRDLNIALANQLAIYSDKLGIDLVALTPLVNSDGEAGLLQPGIGVGGHCTPVYPYFMIDSFREAGLDFTLAAEARKINEQMTDYAASLVGEAKINEQMTGYAASLVVGDWGTKVLILGLAFRAGVREDAFSPTYNLHRLLKDRGYETCLHDPEYNLAELREKGFEGTEDVYSTGAGIVFLVTMHEEYKKLDAKKLFAAGVRIFIDGRNLVDRQEMEAAGIIYKGIGH